MAERKPEMPSKSRLAARHRPLSRSAKCVEKGEGAQRLKGDQMYFTPTIS